jgi:flagellar protein FlaG
MIWHEGGFNVKVEGNVGSYAGIPTVQEMPRAEKSTPQVSPVQKSEKSPNSQTDIREYKKQNPSYSPTGAEKVIIDVIETANKKLMGIHTEFEFAIHEQTKQIMVKVMNAETKEVLREIPPEKILDMVAKMWEMAGLFVDEKR